VTGGGGIGITPPSRTDRNEHRRRSRQIEAIVTVIVVAVAGAYAWTRTNTTSAAAPTGTPSATVHASPGPAAGLTVLTITGGSGPMIMVVGGQPSPVAVSFPQRLTQIVPGMGETSLDLLGQLDGPTVRIGVSNTLGVWVRHYGVASARSIAEAVDAAGGLPVDLGRAFKVNGGTVGPGQVTLTGRQATAYLTGPKSVAAAHWGVFSAAILRAGLVLPRSSLVDTDDAAAVSHSLSDARGGRSVVLPVTDVGGLVESPDFTAIDALATRMLGSTAAPIPVIVQNGNGVPGVGAKVAARLIPAGFRVVLSANAPTFTVQRTSVTALGSDAAAAAKRVRHVLGVGMVSVSSVPSGVGEVKIVLGKDFK
jgi:LytR cell envelope-related transcriptional attenuator